MMNKVKIIFMQLSLTFSLKPVTPVTPDPFRLEMSESLLKTENDFFGAQYAS